MSFSKTKITGTTKAVKTLKTNKSLLNRTRKFFNAVINRFSYKTPQSYSSPQVQDMGEPTPDVPMMKKSSKKLILEPVSSINCLNTIITDSDEVHLIHINDFYEIFNDYCNFSNLENHIMKLKEKKTNVALIIAGDILSPSPMTKWKLTAEIKQTVSKNYQHTILGKNGNNGNGFHIIHLLCELGKICEIPIFATLGNHEFDVPVEDLLLRLKESYTLLPEANFGKICYIVSNIDKSETKLLQDQFYEFTLTSYTYKNLNLIGIVGGMSFNSKLKSKNNEEIIWDNIYSNFFNNTENLTKLTNFIETNEFNNIIAITHLNQPEDEFIWNSLQEKKKNIQLIMGGHEHYSTVTHDANRKRCKIYKGDGDLFSFHHHVFKKNNLIKSYIISNEVFNESKVNQLTFKDIYKVQKFYENLYFEYNPTDKHVIGTVRNPIQLIEQTLRSINGNEVVMNWCDKMYEMMEKNLYEMTKKKITDDMKIAVCIVGGSIRYDGVFNEGQIFRKYDIKKISPFVNKLVLIKLDFPIFIDWLKCYNNDVLAQGKSGKFWQYKLYNMKKDDKLITHIITHEFPTLPWGEKQEYQIEMPFGNMKSKVLVRDETAYEESFINTLKLHYLTDPILSDPMAVGGKKKINTKKNKTYKKKRPTRKRRHIKTNRAGKMFRMR